MEEKNKKELIDVIRRQLKAGKEVPYREGAWENFRTNYVVKKPVKRIFPMYWGAAAAVLLLVFGLLYTYRWSGDDNTVQQQLTVRTSDKHILTEDNAEMDDRSQTDVRKDHLDDTYDLRHIETPYVITPAVLPKRDMLMLGHENTSTLFNIIDLPVAVLPDISTRGMDATSLALSTNAMEKSPLTGVDLGSNLTMAQQADPAYGQTTQKEQPLMPKRLRITDRMEIGAFVSPGVTQESFDLSGGLVLGYQLNDRLTLRTGASFHQYEVNILGSDLIGKSENPREEMSMANGAERLAAKGIPYQSTNVILPNLNAVTGKVQALDIPLELKYNIGKRFYSTAGVSYVAVLSQERYNHYAEYSQPVAYSSESDSGQPTNPPSETVERVTKSPESNVNTNGFGGFVNFSLGRQTQISRRLKLSIEPYVKIPVGQFKRTDMNYTNGGVRIMTHF